MAYTHPKMSTISTINDLAGETYLDIFEYFYINELFDSFWDLNYRLNSLICENRIPLAIRFTDARENESAQFARKFYSVSMDRTCIRSYTLSSNDLSQQQLLFIGSFSKLQSLIIDPLRNVDSIELKRFLFDQPQQPSLKYVSIKFSTCFSPKEFDEILDCLYQIQSLTTLKVYGNRQMILQLSLPLHVLNIQRLTLVPFPIDCENLLLAFAKYLPNLCYLNGTLNSLTGADNADRPTAKYWIRHHSALNMAQSSCLMPNLKQLYFDFHCPIRVNDFGRFDQILSSLLLSLPKLEKITLVFYDRVNKQLFYHLFDISEQSCFQYQYDEETNTEIQDGHSRMKIIIRITRQKAYI
ncbi:unnamed protein product [Didymodactylos carnosus]|uniref:F-box domain-containing protein n=1 Tax=Didymodactylos carnosus TaxID=1234261 RepID=A0A8S2IAV6_9BILA|nr:unnamed protein product [Didymodactylos carnosus]CAF3730896.1 unnamed protein product [Didymodactylos carnosus]